MTRTVTSDPGVVLDTHVLIWLLAGDERISRALRQTIDNASYASGAHVSVISLWEVSMLAAKDKLTLSAPVSRQWRRILA